MKKAPILFLIILALLFSITGCAEKPSVTGNADSAVNGTVTKSVNADNLPFEISYKDKSLSLDSIMTYESKDSYGYNLFIVSTLDVSSFTDDEVRQIRSEDLLSVSSDITSEKNNLDDEYAMILGSLYYTNTKKLVYVHMSDIGLVGTSSEPYLHSFIDSSYTVSISLKEEKYGIPNYYLFCRGTVTKLSDPDTISNPLHDHIVEWLNEKAEFWTGMNK